MRTGRLTVTPGNVIDFGWIEADLLEMASRFEVQAVAFDPFQATQLSTRMLAEGLPMIEVRPTVLNFSEPMKTLEALVLQKKLAHDGDPVLTWMASNVVAHLDVKDNIYPRKERAENKIDGIVALITLGEGYHNFHHQFPGDYRNGVRAWQFDPTKWIVKALSWVRVTRDLRKVSQQTIDRAKAQANAALQDAINGARKTSDA